MGFVLGILCVIAVIYFWFKAISMLFWRYGGTGERQARAEYARLLREAPGSPETARSEVEFVNTYLAERPSALKFLVLALLVSIVGIPMACAMQIASM